jgi:hypothetical protein
MRLKPLLAVAVTAVTVCSAAPSAHAGWMTGRGSLPVARGDAVCSYGMDFKVATYVSSVPHEPLDVPTIRFPPNSDLLASRDPIILANLGVWVDIPNEGVEASPVVDPADHVIPFAPLYIDPTEIGGAVGTWPGGPGNFTHSGQLRLDFNRWVAPGTSVRVGWGNWNPDTPNSTAFAFTVQRCRGSLHPIGP